MWFRLHILSSVEQIVNLNQIDVEKITVPCILGVGKLAPRVLVF